MIKFIMIMSLGFYNNKHILPIQIAGSSCCEQYHTLVIEINDLWLFVFVWLNLIARTPVERESNLGMKIRYPMECFNGKKMSIFRVTVFFQKSVIMQKELRLETDCIGTWMLWWLCICVDVAVHCAVCTVYSFMHVVSKYTFVASMLSSFLTRSPIHTDTLGRFTLAFNMHIFWWHCSVHCGWW